jgi:DNA processing protein
VTLETLREAGLSAAEAMMVVSTRAWEGRPGVSFLRAGAPGWPDSLQDLPYGPVALSLEGNLALLAEPGVGIVGARACTSYGREWATRIASAVVSAGGVVVSGLASGIDTAAHTAANGATIAVLGQGLDAPMPAWQQRLRDGVLARGGLVVSELPPHGHASVFTFPIRNRIIAGLSRVVAVIEAGARSGARNTASHALRCGRGVMALPGPLGATASVGCLDLIEEGAGIIRGAASVLDAAGLLAGPAAAPPGARRPEDVRVAHIWGLLATAATAEELCERAGLGYPVVMEALGLLELTGRAIRLPGGRYQARAT